jgi:hypothetical protein
LILFFAKKCVSRVAKRMAPNSKMRRGSASAYTHIAHYQEKNSWRGMIAEVTHGMAQVKKSGQAKNGADL